MEVPLQVVQPKWSGLSRYRGMATHPQTESGNNQEYARVATLLESDMLSLNYIVDWAGIDFSILEYDI